MSACKRLEVMLIMEDLLDIPEPKFPPGYRIVSFMPGDELIWLKIQNNVDRDIEFDHNFFKKQYEMFHIELQRRLFFLMEGELPIGTITAWVDDVFMDQDKGRIHWVAIIKEKQGKGLSRPMLNFALHRLAEYGHHSAYLTTDTSRVKAIKLYLSAGFKVLARNTDEQLYWDSCNWSDKYI